MFDTLPTVQVVDVIDRLYRRIDNLTEKQHPNIEKIKTVGDTYMAAAGLPVPTDTHACDMSYFAFALAAELARFNKKYHLGEKGQAGKLDFKIGISSGPVVAGVIGKKNPVYDLWGDAANTASRMYSFGKKHRIQTTQETVDMIDGEFICESRGLIQVKGKGLMECFFIIKPINPKKHGPSSTNTASAPGETSAGGTSQNEDQGSAGANTEVSGIKKLVRRFSWRGNKNEVENGGGDARRTSNSAGSKTSGVSRGIIRRQRKASNKTQPLDSITRNAPIHMMAHLGEEAFLQQIIDSTNVFESKEQQNENEAARQEMLGIAVKNLNVSKDDWIHDDDHPDCQICHKHFTFFFRRHHCRFCGNLVCDDCTQNRLEKQRICKNCMKAYEDSTEQIEWMREANEKREKDQLRHATEAFTSPFLAVIGTSGCGNCRDSKLRELNLKYQEDRVNEMSKRQLMMWMLFLTGSAVFLHFLNANILVNDCNSVIQWQSNTRVDGDLAVQPRSIGISSCGEDVLEDITKHGSAVRNTTLNGVTHTVNMTLVLTRDDIAMASLVQGFVFYPLTVLYIYLTQQKFSRNLFMGAELVLTITLVTLLALTLSYSVFFAYVLCAGMLLQQITSPMEMAVSMCVCVVLWSIYVLYMIATTMQDYPHPLFTWDDFLNHSVEKQSPVVFIALFAGYIMDTNNREMYLKTESIKKQRKAIQTEQEKNKELLSLPKIILEGLQQNEGKAPVIDAYGTVLYADIVSFTVFSGMVEAFQLVKILDDMFEMHDDLALKLGVDKVKTLGDCYVACTGVLSPIANHAATMVKFGLGMHLVMKRLNDKFDLHGNGPKGKDLRIRVGIASGAVIGGVVGGKKFIFDLWGDVVENAELMESGGIPELVQVSQSTYLRSMKDRNLSFKRRPERVPGAAHASYMVDIPEEGIENFIDRITGANGPDGGPPPSPKKRSVDGESIAAARYSLLPGVAHKSDTPPDSRTGSVFSETSSRVSSIAGSGFKQGDSYDTPASVSSPPAPSNGGEGKRRSLGVARNSEIELCALRDFYNNDENGNDADADHDEGNADAGPPDTDPPPPVDPPPPAVSVAANVENVLSVFDENSLDATPPNVAPLPSRASPHHSRHATEVYGVPDAKDIEALFGKPGMSPPTSSPSSPLRSPQNGGIASGSRDSSSSGSPSLRSPDGPSFFGTVVPLPPQVLDKTSIVHSASPEQKRTSRLAFELESLNDARNDADMALQEAEQLQAELDKHMSSVLEHDSSEEESALEEEGEEVVEGENEGGENDTKAASPQTETDKRLLAATAGRKMTKSPSQKKTMRLVQKKISNRAVTPTGASPSDKIECVYTPPPQPNLTVRTSSNGRMKVRELHPHNTPKHLHSTLKETARKVHIAKLAFGHAVRHGKSPPPAASAFFQQTNTGKSDQ